MRKLLAILLLLAGPVWGQVWTIVTTPGSATHIRDFAIIPANNHWFVCDRVNGLFKSTNQGSSWSAINNSGIPTVCWTITWDTIHSQLIAGIQGNGGNNSFWRSSNEGTSWTQIQYSFSMGVATAYSGPVVTPSGTITEGGWYSGGNQFCGAWYSTDGGNTTTPINFTLLPGGSTNGCAGAWSFFYIPVTAKCEMGTEIEGILESGDCINFTQVAPYHCPYAASCDVPSGGGLASVGNVDGISYDTSGNILFAAQGGIFKSSGAPGSGNYTWSLLRATAGAGRTVFRDPNGFLYYGQQDSTHGNFLDQNAVYQSQDQGATWQPFTSGIPLSSVGQNLEAWRFVFNPNDGKLYANIQDGATNSGSVYVTVLPIVSATGTPTITSNGAPTGNCTSNTHDPTFFNNAANWGTGAGQIGPGSNVLLCGTFVGAAGSTLLTFQGNGTSSSPITLTFDTGTTLSAPFWAASGNGTGCGGAICLFNRSNIVIDGGTNGIIQNTANGSSLANQVASVGVYANPCQNCTVRNLTIQNLYVNVAGSGIVDNTTVRAIDFAGSNWTITGNTLHDCGWCLFDAYNNGDSNITIGNNNIYNFGHGLMFAASAANNASGLFFHDNHLHDTANWSAPGCPYHQDGIHAFGTAGSSMDQIFVWNNTFDGDWGSCPTGYIFIEAAGGGTPAHMRNSTWWNNLFNFSGTAFINTNGWFNIASGDSGTQKVFNNTLIYANNSDNTNCMVMQNLSNVSFQNNVITNCGDPVRIDSSTLGTVNNNLYGPSCQNGGNCFIWNGAFTGSFANWKAACHCDAASIQSNSPGINSNGTLQAGSLAKGLGANLTSQCTGNTVGLCTDRVGVGRPTSGGWDAGGFQSTGGPPPGPAPTNLQVIVQ